MPESLTLPGPPAAEPTRLLLIAHAESIHRRYGPGVAVDSGLSARGWEQASALARWLAQHETIHALVSGPQLRSQLTAQRIAQALGLSVTVADELPAVDLPLARQSPVEALDALLDQVDSLRLRQIMGQILQDRWGQTVALVTGPVTVAAILRLVAESPRGLFWVEHATISEACFCHRTWHLRTLNLREHLPRATRTAALPGASLPVSKADWEELAQIRRFYNRVAQIVERPAPAAHQTVIHEVLMRMVEGAVEGRALVVGSSLGDLVVCLATLPFREVLGVDVSPMMLEQAELRRVQMADTEQAARMGFRLAAAQEIPFADHTFSWAVLPLLLHHSHDVPRILAEARRVLRPEGRLLVVEVAAPSDPVHRATHNAIEARRNPTHVAIRSLEEWRQLLEESGFQLERERVVSVEYQLEAWLDEVAADPGTREAVRTMLEASMETDAAGLHVRQRDGSLIFEKQVAFLRAVRP